MKGIISLQRWPGHQPHKSGNISQIEQRGRAKPQRIGKKMADIALEHRPDQKPDPDHIQREEHRGSCSIEKRDLKHGKSFEINGLPVIVRPTQTARTFCHPRQCLVLRKYPCSRSVFAGTTAGSPSLLRNHSTERIRVAGSVWMPP